MEDIKLIHLCASDLMIALRDVLNDREQKLREHLRDVQGIDVDRKIWTSGLHGLLYAFENMKTDETVKSLVDANKILEDVKARMEV